MKPAPEPVDPEALAAIEAEVGSVFQIDATGYATDLNKAFDLADRANLLIRPAMSFHRHWKAGQFRGLTLDGKAYCWEGTECEAATPAIALCLAALQAVEMQHRREHDLSLDDPWRNMRRLGFV